MSIYKNRPSKIKWFKKRCKNEFKDNNEQLCSWSRNRVSQKIGVTAVWTYKSIPTAREQKVIRVYADAMSIVSVMWPSRLLIIFNLIVAIQRHHVTWQVISKYSNLLPFDLVFDAHKNSSEFLFRKNDPYKI